MSYFVILTFCHPDIPKFPLALLYRTKNLFTFKPVTKNKTTWTSVELRREKGLHFFIKI